MLTFTSGNWASARTVTVTAVDDDIALREGGSGYGYRARRGAVGRRRAGGGEQGEAGEEPGWNGHAYPVAESGAEGDAGGRL